MCGIDPKGFCTVEGVTSGIGWWWGEVGGVVAGGDGSVADDGGFTDMECQGTDSQTPRPTLTPSHFFCSACFSSKISCRFSHRLTQTVR